MTFLDRLNQFPPYVVRLAALKGRGRGARWKSLRDIARDSGLSTERVSQISFLTHWGTIPAQTIVQFTKGCGVQIDNHRGRDRLVEFIAKAKMVHLRHDRLTSTQRAVLSRLLALSKAK